MPMSAEKPKYVRTFDLGGSGLKTKTWIQCTRYDLPVSMEPNEKRIGKCNSSLKIADWVRRSIETFDEEIGNTSWLFSFSLAGLEKMWEKDRHADDADDESSDKDKILKYFGIDKKHTDRVFMMHDSEAHLLGSMHDKGSDFIHPAIHISVGTGFGFSSTNNKGEIRKSKIYKSKFGKDPWKLVCDNSIGVQKMLTATGYGDTCKLIPSKELKEEEIQVAAAKIFQHRYARFIEKTMFPIFKEFGWPLPKACYLTGGIIDSIGSEMIPNGQICVKCGEDICYLIPGPKYAAHFGVCCLALKLIEAKFEFSVEN